MADRRHKEQPTRRRHALVAFIVARAEAEKRLRGKPDLCRVGPATFQALLAVGNKQDFTVKADPDQAPVLRGVTLEVDAEPERKDAWSFEFVTKQAEAGQAPPHDPVAAAKWNRQRRAG